MFDPYHLRARVVARHVSSAIAVASLSAFVACSDSSTAARGAGSNQLSFTTTSSSGLGAASLDRAPLIKGKDTLTLSQVTIVIQNAKLKRQASSTCTGDNDADDDKSGDTAHTAGHMEDCASVRVGPTLVDLPLDSGLVSLPMDLIPAGTFQQIEFRISLARLVGKFDGKAFDVTLPINGKMVVQFSKPLVVTDSTPTSITIDVPIAQWLTNSDGSIVNPNTILSNPTVFAAVKARIAATFHVFRDDNHNGHDDDHDGGDHDGN